MQGHPTLESLRSRPNALTPDYARFRVGERILLTGHSHQAWPDCGFEGQQRAWTDAAELVDDKWERAFAMADRVRRGYARLLGEDSAAAENIALAASTHDLLVRLLSALPLRERPRLVATDGEFHTVRRQLDRLAEEGLEVVRVPVAPHETVAERLSAAVDDRTTLVMVSSVLFGSGRMVRGLDRVAAACDRCGADLLVDSYHHLNAVPFSVSDLGLETAFIVGGGYKYCQLGEGNAFLRIPPDRELRPAITGWYAEYALLGRDIEPGTVAYGTGAAQLDGATYDPASHYRAAAVLDYFESKGLTPEFLRDVSRHQVGVLAAGFDACDLDPDVIRRPDIPPAEVAGFLALQSERAGEFCRRLRERGIYADSRGAALRLGPAPYLDDGQLDDAIAALAEIVRG